MISFLASFVNLLAKLIQNTFYFTSSIGQVIVILITTVITVIQNIIGHLLTFSQIVYEDNKGIFTEDLPNWTMKIVYEFSYQCGQFYELLLYILQELFNQLHNILLNIKWSFDTVFIIVGDIAFTLKKIIVLLGNTFWFLLTFIPVHLPYLINEVMKKIKETLIYYIIDSYMALLKITNFLSDVPLESFMGIIMTVIIVRSCISFQTVLQTQICNFYWACVRKVLFIYHYVLNYFTDSEVRVIVQIAGDPVPRTQDIDDEINVAADALCVICQERQKCVLTLPCRHVCLCSECCMRLYGYQRTCPICRTFIYHSVTIYM